MKKIALLFVLLPFFSFKPTTNDNDIFFGDSITFGNELGALQFTARWSTQYCNEIPTYEINEAHSGASMAPNPFNRPVFNINEVPAYDPSFRHIFVSYWVNDYLYGTSPAAYAAATAVAVDGIKAKGWPAAKIVLCFNYLPESEGTWVNMTDAKAQQWLSALRSVQQVKGTSFLDFYTPIRNRPDNASYTGDYIHPTAAWNTVMKQYAKTNIEEPSSILPVNFISFSGQRQASANVLKWTVAQEQEVLRYDVNRSSDGINWTTRGEVTSLGNTATQRSYNFIDNNPSGGKQYYRLLVIEKKGASRFSSTVIVRSAKPLQLSLEGLFPNPARSALNVVVNAPIKETVMISVLDLSGRTVSTQQAVIEAGTNTVNLDLSAVSAGTYFFRLNAANQTNAVERFVKE